MECVNVTLVLCCLPIRSQHIIRLNNTCAFSDTTDASEEVKVHFTDEVFRIESGKQQPGDSEGVARTKKPECDFCKDNSRRKCKHCACSVCGGKNDPDKQILCDECDQAYHLWCLSPPLETVPDEDEW